MSGRRDGDGDAAGILLAELAKLEAERDRLNAEVEMYKRQLMAQADLTQLLEGRPAADGTGPIARVPGPRAAGHRKDRTHLRLVKLLIPAAIVARLAVKGSATRKVAGVALAAMVGVPAAAGVTHVIERTPYQVAVPAAVSVTVPAVPSPAGSPAVVTRPVRRRRKPAPVVVPPPRPSLSPAPPPASSPAPTAPLLTVPGEVDLGVYVTGQVTIGDPQGQAVSWSVTCGQDVTVTPSQGVLEPGQQGVQLQVQAAPVDGALGGLCTFWPGGERLTVTWAGAGSPSSAAMSG